MMEMYNFNREKKDKNQNKNLYIWLFLIKKLWWDETRIFFLKERGALIGGEALIRKNKVCGLAFARELTQDNLLVMLLRALNSF